MTPAAYNALRERLGQTHQEMAELLGVEPQTSRVWALEARDGPDRRAEITLKLIEHLGVDEARAVITQRQERRK